MDREILQNDVDRLVEWVKLWKMSFNNEKCKIMRIHSGRSQSVKNIIEIIHYWIIQTVPDMS